MISGAAASADIAAHMSAVSLRQWVYSTENMIFAETEISGMTVLKTLVEHRADILCTESRERIV